METNLYVRLGFDHDIGFSDSGYRLTVPPNVRTYKETVKLWLVKIKCDAQVKQSNIFCQTFEILSEQNFFRLVMLQTTLQLNMF